MEIIIDNCREGYITLCRTVLEKGGYVAPRGLPTSELQAATIVLTDPRNCLVAQNGRNANLAIGAAEAVQLIGGFSDPALMVKLSKNFEAFMDGGEFYGAYGPRVKGQLAEAARQLRLDRDSRRVRVQIWRPDDLFAKNKHDYPCTMGFTFHIRNGKLNMHTHMRSNDVWWGFTYDVLQFCLLQMTMADMIGVGYGEYYHHVDSLHIYRRDVESIAKLTVGHRSPVPPRLDSGLRGGTWSSIERQCKLIAEAKSHTTMGLTGRTLAGWIGAKLNATS